jgi:hypothetical protein
MAVLFGKSVIVILSCLVGSLILCYGIGYMLHFLDNPFDMMDKMKSGTKPVH